MKQKISVEDRERIETRLRQIQEQKNLEEKEKKRDDIRRGVRLPGDEHRKDDKWDINQMSEFDFVRCDYSEW